jgi:predicted DNA-binding WGR domain protein
MDDTAPSPVPFTDYVRLDSVDPGRNRARFFVRAWQRTLWGERVLVRVWGRRGTLGRTAVVRLAPDRCPEPAADALLRRRLRHGYTVTTWR